MEIVAAAVFAVLYCPEKVRFLLLLRWKKRYTVALRNQIARLPPPSDNIGRLGVSMETSYKRELLLAECVCVRAASLSGFHSEKWQCKKKSRMGKKSMQIFHVCWGAVVHIPNQYLIWEEWEEEKKSQ